MLIAKEEVRLHLVIRNPVARLLFLNGLFVIGGYALANATGGVIKGSVSNFKNFFLFISFTYLIVTNKMINPVRYFDSGLTPILFGFLILYVSFGAETGLESMNRTLTFFIPLVYVYLSIAYLVANFGIQLTLRSLHYSLLIIYIIPLLSYIISGGSIKEVNIYGGGDENQFFASNNYGWSATLYILSYLFVWKDIQLRKFAKILFGTLLPVAISLLFASANRASWVSFAIAMVPFFLSYKAIGLKYKIVLVLIMMVFISILLANPNSAINFARNKSQKQEQSGEARFKTSKIMFDDFNSEPTLWITGVGMYNFTFLKNKTNLSSYHNSYWEVLFGAGLPLFIVFLSFIFFRPLRRYVKYYSKYTFLLPPLLIIPFFESNLTAGQFLFFPWFSFMLLLNAKTKFWNKETYAASIHKYKITDTDIIVNETNNPVV